MDSTPAGLIQHIKYPSHSSQASQTTIGKGLFITTKFSSLWTFKERPRKKALLVGICTCTPPNDAFPTLTGPWKDVNEFATLLRDQYGYSSDNITIMLDDPSHPEHLQPTYANLMRELDTFLLNSIPGDKFLFHYAGHTDQQANPDGTEEDGKDEVIVTQDGEMILDDVLHELLIKRLLPGCSLVAILDTCHSQSLLDLPHYRCNRYSKRTRMLRKANEIFTPPPTPTIVQETSTPPPPPRPPRRSASFGTLRRSNTIASVKKKVIKICRGTCHRIVNRNQPYVLCISACKDKEEASDEISMTGLLIEVLKENKRPTLMELIRGTAARLVDRTQAKEDVYHNKFKKYIASKETWIERLYLRTQPIPKIWKELPSPQLSSLSPLFLTDHLSL